MQRLSLCLSVHHCGTSELTDLTLAVLWLRLPRRWRQSSFLSHLLPSVHWAAADVWAVVVFSLLHSISKHGRGARTLRQLWSALWRFGLCRLAAQGESNFPDDSSRRNRWLSATATQQVVLSAAEFRRATSQTSHGIWGGGTEWIRAFACDYYIFIPLAEPSDSYASSQQGVVTTQRRSGNIFLWSNSNWSAEACKLITSSQLLVVLFGIKSNYTQSETAFRCLDHPNVWKQCNLERQLYSMAKTCGL